MKQLGFTGPITSLISPEDYEGYELARVIIEHKERYTIQTTTGIYSAEITGNLRYAAQSRLEFPAVGDWVKVTMMDEKTAIILSVFPRTTILERQAVGKHAETQVIATNIDYAFIVQAAGQDFNLKRLERYLAICYTANIKPILLLSKTDLISDEEKSALIAQINERIKDVPVIPLSIHISESFEAVSEIMEAHKTYCFIGSSGVGKSTIVNQLKDEETLKTSEVSSSNNKGRHTTTHRELLVLSNQSIVIDTPGMREIGMTDNAKGIELTYDEIQEISNKCKFNDCSHVHEVGCAVLQAVEEGRISKSAYDNYHKMKREQLHFSSSVHEKRQRSKSQVKMYREIQTERRKRKY